MNIYYSIEEQLERINEEVEEFTLSKPADEMNEAELDEAENEAAKYVEWIEDEDYIQFVPKVKKTGKIVYPL